MSQWAPFCIPSPLGDYYYCFWNTVLRGVLSLGCKVRTYGAEWTSTPGGWILAGNHISHFDPPLVSSVCRRPVDWMAMKELFSNKVFASLLYWAGAFPVSRGKADRMALREAGKRLAAGRVVGIFPEGGIRDGARSIVNGGPMLPGVAMLAHAHRCPVLPFVILGSDRLYNKRYWLLGHRATVWIAFGEPFYGADRNEISSRLAEAIITLRNTLIKHFGLADSDLPRSPAERMREL